MSPPEKRPAPLTSQLSEIRGRITRTQWIWLTNAGVCIITLGVGFIAIQAPWQERRQQLASQYAEESERSDLLKEILQQRSVLRTLEKKLLLEGGATALTSQISQLAAEAGLQIESVTPQPELVIDPYLKYQIEIQASSSLTNVLRFLHSVENHVPVLWADQLEIGEFPGESSSTFSGIPFERQSPDAQKSSDLHQVKLIIGALSRQRTS